jgi:hypothetical protein
MELFTLATDKPIKSGDVYTVRTPIPPTPLLSPFSRFRLFRQKNHLLPTPQLPRRMPIESKNQSCAYGISFLILLSVLPVSCLIGFKR